jgi:hypothetical protein
VEIQIHSFTSEMRREKRQKCYPYKERAQQLKAFAAGHQI